MSTSNKKDYTLLEFQSLDIRTPGKQYNQIMYPDRNKVEASTYSSTGEVYMNLITKQLGFKVRIYANSDGQYGLEAYDQAGMKWDINELGLYDKIDMQDTPRKNRLNKLTGKFLDQVQKMDGKFVFWEAEINTEEHFDRFSH